MAIYPYLGIVTAAAVEGEVVYVSAVVMASLGRLDPLAVLLSGALTAVKKARGAALGDGPVDQ